MSGPTTLPASVFTPRPVPPMRCEVTYELEFIAACDACGADAVWKSDLNSHFALGSEFSTYTWSSVEVLCEPCGPSGPIGRCEKCPTFWGALPGEDLAA